MMCEIFVPLIFLSVFDHTKSYILFDKHELCCWNFLCIYSCLFLYVFIFFMKYCFFSLSLSLSLSLILKFQVIYEEVSLNKSSIFTSLIVHKNCNRCHCCCHIYMWEMENIFLCM